jgi:hypothetical protein
MKPEKAIKPKAIVNLDDLLLDISGLNDQEIESRARKLYRELYITSGNFGVHKTHDGEDVTFWDSRFKHVTCTSKDFRFSDEKACLDKPRIERIAWVGEVISGKVPNSACWLLKQNLVKRLYTVVPRGYVVWLEYKGEKKWMFSTAYVTTPQQIHKYTRGEKLIWKYGKSKAP